MPRVVECRTSPVGMENKAGSVFPNAGSISLLQNTLMNILTLMDMHLFQCDFCHRMIAVLLK